MQTVHPVFFRVNGETSTEIEVFRRVASMRLSSVLIIDRVGLRFYHPTEECGRLAKEIRTENDSLVENYERAGRSVSGWSQRMDYVSIISALTCFGPLA